VAGDRVAPPITSLTLPEAVYRAILAHARDSLPREAVGVIGGTPDGVARRIISLSNVVSGGDAFLAHPHDQYLALRRLASEGLSLIAIYHSHPGGGTEPSPLDLRYASRCDCAHLIVAVGCGGAPDGDCRAFRVASTGTACPVTVTIAPSP
jgi:proteasome lid subunit RPN8/RPN11